MVTRTPSFVGGIKIRVNGIRKGNELTGLTFHKIEKVPIGYHSACPTYQSDQGGDLDVSTGSIYPEGITIALPLRDSTTITKHESLVAGGLDVDHKVEIYAPRQHR